MELNLWRIFSKDVCRATKVVLSQIGKPTSNLNFQSRNFVCINPRDNPTNRNHLKRKQEQSDVLQLLAKHSIGRVGNSYGLHSQPLGNQQNVVFEKTSDEVKNLLSLLHEVLKLKNVKPPSLIVENKLKPIFFFYNNFTKEEREDFLKKLSTEFGVNQELVLDLSKQLSSLEGNDSTKTKLQDSLLPRYNFFFTHLSRLENGIQFLVDLRKDILELVPTLELKSPESICLQILSNNLKDVLSSSFSPAFLQLERVKWTSPCSLLEKLTKYEAVHPLKSWAEMKQRLGPYRRCFIYKHVSLTDEPLVILHVGLTDKISDSVNSLLHNDNSSKDLSSINMSVEENPMNVKAFIFYSISSTQKGLQGVDLGNYLIKRACYQLHEEFPLVKQFSTLSPIPTFRKWLLNQLNTLESGDGMLELKKWQEVLDVVKANNSNESLTKLKEIITDNSWVQDERLIEVLKVPLMTACCQYLYSAKKRGYTWDSVANFHLRNGAVMWRLNWLADTSTRGLSNSCGLMVNYRYYLDSVDVNGLKYIQQKAFTASEDIVKMATGHSF